MEKNSDRINFVDISIFGISKYGYGYLKIECSKKKWKIKVRKKKSFRPSFFSKRWQSEKKKIIYIFK